MKHLILIMLIGSINVFLFAQEQSYPKLNSDAILNNEYKSPYGEYNKEIAAKIEIVKFEEMYKYAENLGIYVARYPNYATWRDNEEHFAERQSPWERTLNAFKTIFTYIKSLLHA